MTHYSYSFPSAQLAAFASNLRFNNIPQEVVDRITDLYVDWAGSALSGKPHRAINIIEEFADTMGPDIGSCEILTSRKKTSPFFAAMVNAAASHISEQDDVHNGSVFHPATIVFPAALAIAQDKHLSGQAFLTACVVGYEVGIRVGEFLGRSHYEVFHTTGTAGTFASAAAVGNLLGLDEDQMLHAFGSAGTQSAGLWEFLRDAADSKQLHTAKSASEGLMSAIIAQKGFTGAKQILEGKQGLAAGMSTDSDVSRLTDQLGSRWSVLETSFKFHASCRHTHPAADALLKSVLENDLKPEDIRQVICHVHQAAIDVLGPVTNPQTVHQAKFSMPATLGLIATHRKAGLSEFAQVLEDKTALSFLDKIHMKADDEVNSAYPKRWIGKVTVTLKNGQEIHARVDEPKGDPGNTLSRDELDVKARSLALSGGAVGADELDKVMDTLWSISSANRVGFLFD